MELVVGGHIPEERARELVASGRAAWGPAYALPPALYLEVDMTIRGVLYRAGSLLQVGGHITEPECLMLMCPSSEVLGGAMASFPGWGPGCGVG